MFNWVTLLIGLAGIYLGYKLNQYANEQSESRIIAAFNAKIDELKNKAQTNRATTGDQQTINTLEEMIKLLENK